MPSPDDCPLLGFAADNAIERRAMIGFIRSTGATRAEAMVLRWLIDEIGDGRGIVADAHEIASDYWVHLSVRAVRYALESWGRRGVILLTQRHDDRGVRLPPYAALVPGSVPGRPARHGSGSVPAGENTAAAEAVTSAGQGPPVAAPGRPASARSAAGNPNANGEKPNANSAYPNANSAYPIAKTAPFLEPIANSPPSNGDRIANSAPLHGAQCVMWERSPEAILAATRAVSVSVSVVVVVDNNNSNRATWQEVQMQAAEAAAILWGPGKPVPAAAHVLLHAAATLALLLFGRKWLLASAEDAAEAKRDGRARNYLRFFVGCLRNEVRPLAEVGPFRDTEALRSWFSAIMRPMECAVETYLPPPAALAKPVAPAAVADPPMTIEQWRGAKKEIYAALATGRAASEQTGGP